MRRWQVQLGVALLCWGHIVVFPAAWPGLFLGGAANLLRACDNFRRDL